TGPDCDDPGRRRQPARGDSLPQDGKSDRSDGGRANARNGSATAGAGDQSARLKYGNAVGMDYCPGDRVPGRIDTDSAGAGLCVVPDGAGSVSAAAGGPACPAEIEANDPRVVQPGLSRDQGRNFSSL